MVAPGAQAAKKSNAKEIAWYTVRTLSRVLPPAVKGVMFLSGGQSEEEATE